MTDCPASLQAEQGTGINAILKASDGDSIVSSAVIESGAVAGISLSGFAPSASVGASASANLVVDASVAAGSYPIKVTFGNGDGQSASCTVAVRVAGDADYSADPGRRRQVSRTHNTVQTTEGVVTANVGSGFFLQDAKGDGDPATSDAHLRVRLERRPARWATW